MRGYTSTFRAYNSLAIYACLKFIFFNTFLPFYFVPIRKQFCLGKYLPKKTYINSCIRKSNKTSVQSSDLNFKRLQEIENVS